MTQDDKKKAAALAAIEYVKDGDIIGYRFRQSFYCCTRC